MFAAESYTSRHYIAIVAMACLCVLLGGPSYAAGAESLIIAGATYYEPGASGPGWAWTDADHLELNGYAGEAIGADGDLVLTLAGQNSVTESHAPDADITLCGMEVWGNLTLRGTGTLTATGSQCGIHVSQALVADGCIVDARADGADITDEAVAGVIAGDMAVRGDGRVVAAGAGSGAGVRAYGVNLQDAGIGASVADCRLSVDASWLDATGANGGVACLGGSLVSARFVSPAGGTFGASGVVDASGTETRCHDNQDNNDSNQDHGRQDVQAQDCHRNNCGTPKDRRQPLDSRVHIAVRAGNNAPGRHISLLKHPFR